MAVWSYVPQELMTTTWTLPVRTALVSPQTLVVGTLVDSVTAGFRLQYTQVDSQTTTEMGQFFTARRGAFEAFDFHFEGQTYRVRFDTDVTVDWFHPIFLRLNTVNFMAVTS